MSRVGCLASDCMIPYVLGAYSNDATWSDSSYMATPAPHALNAPPWQRIETTMMSTARDIRLAYDNCFEPLNLNLSQASLVGYIAENGPMNQTQLAAALVLGRAATGSLVDQLEKRGLVQRAPDPDDRRVWLVENTAHGADVAVEIVSIDEQLRKRVRVGITREERHQLADLLLRMSANAVAAVDETKTQSKTSSPETGDK